MAQKIAVVTVHGTNDTKESPEGTPKKWWEPTSRFCERLRAQLAAKGFEAEIFAHKWSGANSALAREQGAADLAVRIRGYARGRSGLHVIGHSHGGNVANNAAELLGWGKRGRESILDSLTTVGTPFFKPNFGAAQYFGAIAFLALTVASLATLGLITFASIQQRIANGDPAYVEMASVVAIFIVTVFAYMLAFPLAIQGARRIRRFRERLRTGDKILTIWHPNDEAISFLQRVERLNLQPFPKGALYRGSRMPAILLSVRLVLALAVLAILVGGGSLLILALSNAGVIGADSWLQNFRLERTTALTLIGVAVGGALVFFSIAYLVLRLMFGLVPEMAFRNSLNRWIGGLLRGMAFGADTDQRLTDVSTISHSHPSIEQTIGGELAARMQTGASGAAGQLIEKYRWALFNVAESDNETLTHMAEDALTWDSLIHTTYFDHDEMADMIAAHIASAKLD